MVKDDYQKTIFQLNEMIRHLLLDSEDVKTNHGYWIEYWEHIEKENQSVFDGIYKTE